MRIVISLGGSVLVEDLSADAIRGYASTVEELRAAGHEVAVVVGGGPIAREYIAVARALDADEVRLDEIGIDVTRLNARLLIEAIGDGAHPWPATTYGEARQAIRQGDTPVLGGIAPAQTTDAVSAATAEHIGAELLIYATSVDGIYSGDPHTGEPVDRYDEIDIDELVELIGTIEMNAGSKGPVDLLAAKIIQRANLRTIVMAGDDPQALTTAALEGDHDGTDIVVDGMADPAIW